MKQPKKFAGKAMLPAVEGLETSKIKVLPHAPEMERLITGALMGDDHTLAEKMMREISFLKREHFFVEADGHIFQAIMELASENSPFDELLVAQKIKQKPATDKVHQNLLEEIGGATTLEKRKREANRKKDWSIFSYARVILQQFYQRDTLEILQKQIEKVWQVEGDNIYELRNDIADSLRAVSESSYLQANTADRDIAEAIDEPDMRRLCGSFIFENTINFLFSSSGNGKSVGAVQIGVSIAKGEGMFKYKLEDSTDKFLLENDATEGLVTGFVDLELSRKQFKKRYTNTEGASYAFGEKFIRISVNRNGRRKKMDKENTIFNDIENFAALHKIKFLIIDNITKLSPESKSDAEVVQRLMERFEYLRDKYGLTLLIIAHTPKRANNTQPVTMHDMSGSAIATDFSDSVFTINTDNNDKRLKYWKQVKSRDEESVHGEENVIRTYMETAENGTFLSFSFQGCGHEREHLEEFMKKEIQDNLIENAIALKIKHPEKGWRTIAQDMNWNQSFVTLKERMIKFANSTGRYEVIFKDKEVFFKAKAQHRSDS
jgi:CTP:phosphocholine cytidylyltransferase-like protein